MGRGRRQSRRPPGRNGRSSIEQAYGSLVPSYREPWFRLVVLNRVAHGVSWRAFAEELKKRSQMSRKLLVLLAWHWEERSGGARVAHRRIDGALFGGFEKTKPSWWKSFCCIGLEHSIRARRIDGSIPANALKGWGRKFWHLPSPGYLEEEKFSRGSGCLSRFVGGCQPYHVEPHLRALRQG